MRSLWHTLETQGAERFLTLNIFTITLKRPSFSDQDHKLLEQFSIPGTAKFPLFSIPGTEITFSPRDRKGS